MAEGYSTPRSEVTQGPAQLETHNLSQQQVDAISNFYANLRENNGLLTIETWDGRKKIKGKFDIHSGSAFLDESGNLVITFKGKLSGRNEQGKEWTQRREVRIIVSPDGSTRMESRVKSPMGIPVSPWTEAKLDLLKTPKNPKLAKKLKDAINSASNKSYVSISFGKTLPEELLSGFYISGSIGNVHIGSDGKIVIEGGRSVTTPTTYPTSTTAPPSSPEVTASSIAKAAKVKKNVKGGMSSREYYEGHAWALALYLAYGDYDRLPEDVRNQLDRKTYVEYAKYYEKYGIPQGVLDNKGLSVDKLQASIFLSLLVLGTGKVGMETIRNVVSKGITTEGELISLLANDPSLIASAVGKKGYQAYFKGLATEDGSFERALNIIKKAKDARAKWVTEDVFREKLDILASEEPDIQVELPEQRNEQPTEKPAGEEQKEEEQKEEEQATEERIPEERAPQQAPAVEAPEEATTTTDITSSIDEALPALRERQRAIEERNGSKPAAGDLRLENGQLEVVSRGALSLVRGEGVLEFLTPDEKELKTALVAVGSSLEALIGMYATGPVSLVIPEGAYDRKKLASINVKVKIGERTHYLVQIDERGNARIDLAVLKFLQEKGYNKRVFDLLASLGVKPEDIVGEGDISRIEGIDSSAVIESLPASALAAVILARMSSTNVGAYLEIPREKRRLHVKVSRLDPFSNRYAMLNIEAEVPATQQTAAAKEEKAAPATTAQREATEEAQQPATQPTAEQQEQEVSEETVTTEESETPTEATETTDEELPPEPEEVEGADEQEEISFEDLIPE